VSELKRCSCGSEAKLITAIVDGENKPLIVCKTCSMCGEPDDWNNRLIEEELKAKNEMLKEALTFYAENALDFGEKARQAIKETQSATAEQIFGEFGKLKEEKKALKARCSLLSLEVSTLGVRIDKLKIVLQALYDEQNGPPLENDKEDWQEAMRMAEEALREGE
jgi:hypothetical protein